MKINVMITPWAKTNKLDIQQDLMGNEVYKIRLHAKPIDGEANEALIAFLAKHFAVTKQDVQIVSWNHSRHKVIEIK